MYRVINIHNGHMDSQILPVNFRFNRHWTKVIIRILSGLMVFKKEDTSFNMFNNVFIHDTSSHTTFYEPYHRKIQQNSMYDQQKQGSSMQHAI